MGLEKSVCTPDAKTSFGLKGCAKGTYSHFIMQTGNLSVAKYNSKWINPDGTRKKCSFPPCPNGVKSKGFCPTHYSQHSRGMPLSEVLPDNPCPSPECGRMKSATALRCKRCNQFRWRYGLDEKAVTAYLLPENYFCGNLGCDEVKTLHMDHDHACCPAGKFETRHRVSCGKCVRGWLCKGCNNSLGFLQENPRRIQGLLDYLKVKGV